jgi:hypothetical protein
LEQSAQIGFIVHIHLQPRAPAENHAGANAFRFANVFRKTAAAKMRGKKRGRGPQDGVCASAIARRDDDQRSVFTFHSQQVIDITCLHQWHIERQA